jgi:hypothetical protein
MPTKKTAFLKMQKETEPFHLKELRIPILTGTAFDLSRFDFSFKDITIFDIESQGFEKYIENLQPGSKDDNMAFVLQIRKTIFFNDWDKKYAVVNNNPRAHYSYQDIANVWRLLLIIYPSDLQIEHEIEYEIDEGVIHNPSMASWNKRMSGGYPGNLLRALEEDVNEVNEFVKSYLDELNAENYISIAIESYLTSFKSSDFKYEYLTLFIALESIVNSNSEVTYRLRRTAAILCGNDSATCDIIYENLRVLYELRSKIIHGEFYNKDKVTEYLQPLKAIVSKTIIELLIHNIPSNETLNKIINRLAFGDRNKISDKWKPYRLNISTVVDKKLA